MMKSWKIGRDIQTNCRWFSFSSSSNHVQQIFYFSKIKHQLREAATVFADKPTHVFEIGTVWTIYRDFQEIVDEIVN